MAKQTVISGQMEAAKVQKQENKKNPLYSVDKTTLFIAPLGLLTSFKISSVSFPLKVEEMWKLPCFWHSILNSLSALWAG